jgi:hypothetical protein
MPSLTPVEREVLNATSDDFESLEQIYCSVCFEFSSEAYKPSDPTAFWFRNRPNSPSLAEIADAIKTLFEQGLLESRIEDGTWVSSLKDASLMWTGWFHATRKGYSLVASEQTGGTS